jgi:LacI family transcriptional regulator
MKRSRRVAILTNVSQRSDRRTIQGVVTYVRERADWDLYIEEEPLHRLPKLQKWEGRGIIVNFDDRETAMAVRGLKIPVVGFGGGLGWYDPASLIPYFTTDNAGIAVLAAHHLLNCGFSRLACYGDYRSRLHDWCEERIQAFCQQARQAGVPCSVLRTRSPTAQNWTILQRELSVWLTLLPKPVGVLACTDLRARHILQVCRMIGVRVPDDVAVIGVDNDEMLCELTTPPLTSIEQGHVQIGYEAAALLDRLMAGRKASQLRWVIPPEGLVARQSTDVIACPDPDLAAAVRFIRQHACDGIGVQAVLDMALVSRSTLDRKFLAMLGRTIHAEIQRVQVDRAKQLLAGTSLLVKQIAKRCGFRYAEYMTAVFHRHTGQSPIEYRQHSAGDRPQNGNKSAI